MLSEQLEPTEEVVEDASAPSTTQCNGDIVS